jgi:hypothetical protein
MKTPSFNESIRDLAESLERFSGKESPLVIGFFVLFFISATYLSIRVDYDLDPNNGKNWWSLSFDEAKGSSLRFIIDNHSENSHFSYTVSNGKTILDTGIATIKKGESTIISPSASGNMTGRENITVTTDDGKKKEIYREK